MCVENSTQQQRHTLGHFVWLRLCPPQEDLEAIPLPQRRAMIVMPVRRVQLQQEVVDLMHQQIQI
jgi:hypothetical protein